MHHFIIYLLHFYLTRVLLSIILHHNINNQESTADIHLICCSAVVAACASFNLLAAEFPDWTEDEQKYGEIIVMENFELYLGYQAAISRK